MYSIEFTNAATKDFKNLSVEAKNSIREAINGIFSENPYLPMLNVKKLREPLKGYRLRAGNYRILYVIKGNYIQVYKIKDRKDAYR